MSGAKDVLQNEVVTFIQHVLPGFTSGVYELTVSQTVLDAKDASISGDSLKNTYPFAVQSDRFALAAPSTLIDSVFPADNSAGEFDTVLPHVVFTKQSFPWSRDPGAPIVGATVDPDVPTWLHVLLLDEDDLLPSLAPAPATIGDLFPFDKYDKSSLGHNYSYFYKAQSTQLEPGQHLSDPIQIIDLPLELFWKIAPTLADLELAAHVREVNLLIKATEAGGEGPGAPIGTYSIVFGNRLPQTNKKTFAYLVSLEGLGAYLPTDAGEAPSGNSFIGTRKLRLAVLTSWTFASTGQSATFIDQLLALNGRTDIKGPDASDTNLRLKYSGANSLIAAATNMGYAPLNTTVRTGEKAVSWYRGPLAPYLLKASVQIPLTSADAANAFDPTTGVFDQSYGAAWTLGRMLALQDTGFSTALYTWKTGLTHDVISAVENEIINSAFSSVLERGPTPALLDRYAHVTPARALLHKTLQALAAKGAE